MAVADITDIARAIELAVAPVFLLTGIAGLLAVMTNRLARIIDRGRWFDERWSSMDDATRRMHERELSALENRRRLASWAINACTAAALLVCLVVTALFVEVLLEVRLRGLAGVLFIVAMAALIAGLASFLREVYLATQSTRVLASVERLGRGRH